MKSIFIFKYVFLYLNIRDSVFKTKFAKFLDYIFKFTALKRPKVSNTTEFHNDLGYRVLN